MKKVSFFILSLLFIFMSPALSADEKTNKKEMQDVTNFIGYVPNEIVVKFDHSITSKKNKKTAPKGKLGVPSVDQVGERFNVISVLSQFPKAKKKKYKGREIDLSGWHKVKFGGKVDVKAVIKEYKKIPGVIDAQPIGIYPLNSPYIPNDGFSQDQWHLNQENDADIDAPEAWDAIFGNNSTLDDTLIVAVLDTGVRYFHQDIGGPDASYSNPENTDGNIWIKLLEKDGVPGFDDDGVEGNGYIDDWIGWDFVAEAPDDSCGWFLGPMCPCSNGEDCGETDNDPRDFNGHGTHVTGIVSAINNNNYGTASTAGGWGDGTRQSAGNGVKIMPLQICWSADHLFYGEIGLCRMDFAAQALNYAADNGANFVNASWGSGNDGGIADAIDYFLASGGMIFKAAGNDGGETADYINGRTDPGIVSVAVTDSNNCKASFSTHGNWVDISAPGTDIPSSYHVHYDPGLPNPYDAKYYDYVKELSGTSMASPLALSVAALIWSEYPTLTACQIEQRLYDSADDIYGLDCNSSYGGKLGGGRVNAFNAVNIQCATEDLEDIDTDGYSPCDGDCDDTNASVYPGAIEICDAIDNDCDCFVDEGFPKSVANGTINCNSGVPDLSCEADYYNCDSDLENGCESLGSCNDQCPNDPDKTEPGQCGCGVAETDSDGDGTADCFDGCPADPAKTDPGVCGCGTADTDSDGDGTPDCNDGCPNDPGKTDPGVCGCGIDETPGCGQCIPNKKWCNCDGVCDKFESNITCPWDCLANECTEDSSCDDSEDCTADQCVNGECINTWINKPPCLLKGSSCESDEQCFSNKCRGGKCR